MEGLCIYFSGLQVPTASGVSYSLRGHRATYVKREEFKVEENKIGEFGCGVSSVTPDSVACALDVLTSIGFVFLT